MRISKVDLKIEEFNSLKKAPKELFYIGDLSLLKRPKVSIVGSRRPIQYSQNLTRELAFKLAKRGVAVVSGGAMGIDALAHIGAGAKNSIAVMANGLDIRYPAVNSSLIESIEQEGLVISQFPETQRATKWSFVVRNELVVALGQRLVVAQADLNSGSMRSVEYALKMGREIYVFPHRLGESDGTNELLKKGLAKAIFSIDEFANDFGSEASDSAPKDEFFYFCQKRPTLEEAVAKFGSRVYEAELEGIIEIENGILHFVG